MIGVEPGRRRAETAGKHAHVLLLPLVLRPVREQGDVLDRDLGLILAQSMKIASDSDRPRFGLPRKLSPQSLTASPSPIQTDATSQKPQDSMGASHRDGVDLMRTNGTTISS